MVGDPPPGICEITTALATCGFACSLDCKSTKNRLRDAERGFLVITHYHRLLNYIVPDRVHVLVDGRIVRSGGKELALELEEKGYGWLDGTAAAAAAGAP